MRKLLMAGLILTCTYGAFGQQYTADIQNLTVDNGLPDNTVYCFYQDQMGFIWIGNQTGITRYDGHTFKQFSIKSKEQENFPFIKIIGDEQQLLIATKGAGLYQLNLLTHELSQFPTETENIGYGENVKDVFQAKDKSIWMTSEQGVYRKKKTDQYFQKMSLTHQGSDIGNTITQIIEANKGQIILASNQKTLYCIKSSTVENVSGSVECEAIATGQNFQNIVYDNKSHSTWMGVWDQGLFAMDSSAVLTNFKYQERNKSTLSSNQVTGIALDQVGNVWASTNDRGVNLIQQQSDLVQRIIVNNHTAGRHPQYAKAADVFNSLTDYNIRTLFVDRSGMVWIGTQSNGLIKIQLKKEIFKYFVQDIYNDNTLANRDVSYPGITKDGSLWIGTWGGGLHHLTPAEFNKDKPQYRRFFPIDNDTTSISFSRVFPVKEDSKENLWLGTNGGGLNFLAKEEKYKDKPKFVRYMHNSAQEYSLSNNIIRSMLVDSKDRIWVGTDKGLNLLLPDSNHFETNFENFVIRALAEDVTTGTIWMGTNSNGLVSWNPSLKESKAYDYASKGGSKLPLLNILDLEMSLSGILWVGTVDGLFSFDRKKGVLRYCSGQNDVAPKQVESIQIDRNGVLWLGTIENGLFAYEPDKNKFTNFRMTEGRISNSFTEGSSKGSDGTMYFGSRNGFYGFHPDSILLDKMLPRVLITEISAGEKNIPESEIHPLNRRKRDPIVFDYDDEISISFSGLSYTINDPIKYAYNLSRIDKQWNHTNVGEQRITYSNLSPGRYLFSVKSVHHYNAGEPTELVIIINPPWWRTWWSYTLFFLLFATTIYKIRKYRQVKRQQENDHFREKLEREKEERLQQIKLEFFTNVSHEIKTPLTLIKAPVENMLNSDQLSPENREYATLIQSNTERLMRLTNQLLDYRKVSLSQMPVKNESIDVVDVLHKVCLLFGELANKNKVDFIFQSEVSSLVVALDHEKLESIIFNLLTNAFKHTPKEGRIEVLLDLPENEQLQIVVKDNGSGIRKDKIDEIFNLFYTEGTDNNAIQKGTGIGLALVKELTALMKGQVKVESEENAGTSFFVSFDIPAKELDTQPTYLELNRASKGKKILVNTQKVNSNGKELPLLLIAEDDPEMNNYIAMQFSDTYQVIQAYDGKQALELLKNEFPELVITDLMMPEMDGIALCSRLKSELETSHIPVVMLTAKGQDEEKLQGLKTGADAYLTKPFSPDLLKVTVANLIKSRKLLQDKYSKSIQVEPSGITITSVDEKFLQDVMDTVDLHIANSSFTVEQLAKEIGSSVPQLYRKVKAITGLGPNECIRDLRLKRAALLLKESGLSISEISYKVGFGNPKYFSRCFSQQFGCSPRDFKGKVKA